MTASWLVVLALALGVQTPGGWDATLERVQRLVLDRKAAEAIAILERVLKSSPGFDPARYELAEAHRSLALEAALKGPSQDAIRRRELDRAAADYRRVAEGTSDYKPLAIGKLLMVYGKDELDRPADLIPFARQYVQWSPTAAIGHVALANALTATGREPDATSALLGARTAIRADERELLATVIVDYAFKTKTSSAADLKALIEWAEGVLDRRLRDAPNDRDLLRTKAAAAMFRADRLETDPARKRAAKADADRAFKKFEDANPNRGGAQTAPPPSSPVPVPPPPPPPPPPPARMAPEFERSVQDANKLIADKQYEAASALLQKLIKSKPDFTPLHYLRANALLLGGRSAAAQEAVKAARQAISPAAPERHMAATYLFDIVSSNGAIAAADAKWLLAEARAMDDEALKANPKYWEAAVYRSLIVRTQAKFEADPTVVKKLTAEADRLRAQAEAMRPK